MTINDKIGTCLVVGVIFGLLCGIQIFNALGHSRQAGYLAGAAFAFFEFISVIACLIISEIGK